MRYASFSLDLHPADRRLDEKERLSHDDQARERLVVSDGQYSIIKAQEEHTGGGGGDEEVGSPFRFAHPATDEHHRTSK